MAVAISAVRTPIPIQKIGKAKKWNTYLFWGLLLTTLVDMNQIAAMALGADAFLSPLMLLMCIALFVGFQFRFGHALGRSGRLYCAGFLAYCMAGALIRADFTDKGLALTLYYVRFYMPSLVITLAVALGARFLAATRGISYLLAGAFAVLSLHVLGIVLGILAPDLLYSQRTVYSFSGHGVMGTEQLEDAGGRQLGFCHRRTNCHKGPGIA